MGMMMKTEQLKGTHVIVKEGEDINRALRRFKNKIEESGLLKTLQKKEFYEKPTTKRKRMKAAGRSRFLKKLEKQALPKKKY